MTIEQNKRKIMKNKGFTLIEVLVVVLIIGILAAIALPKYQHAMIKSQTATMLSLARSILDAEDRYYLANGRYIGDVSKLDIAIPSTCQHIFYGSYDNNNLRDGEMFSCGDLFILDNSAIDNRVSVNYCPKKNTSWNDCHPNRDFQIAFRGPDSSSETPNSRKCMVFNNSSLGTKICSSYGEFKN